MTIEVNPTIVRLVLIRSFFWSLEGRYRIKLTFKPIKAKTVIKVPVEIMVVANPICSTVNSRAFIPQKSIPKPAKIKLLAKRKVELRYKESFRILWEMVFIMIFKIFNCLSIAEVMNIMLMGDIFKYGFQRLPKIFDFQLPRVTPEVPNTPVLSDNVKSFARDGNPIFGKYEWNKA